MSFLLIGEFFIFSFLKRLWCADTGERLLYLSPAHDYIVWAVRVNLGEVVSFSYDCTAAVWAVSQGDEDSSNKIKAELKRTIKGKRKRWLSCSTFRNLNIHSIRSYGNV